MDDCACEEWEPCISCLAVAESLIGKRVADPANGMREFVVEDDDTKDGRVTVAGKDFWAYLDDVRPVVSHQEVDTLEEAWRVACEHVDRHREAAGQLMDGDEGIYLAAKLACDEIMEQASSCGPIHLPDSSSITVKPVEDGAR